MFIRKHVLREEVGNDGGDGGGAAAGAGGEGEQDWRLGISEDLRENPSLTKFTTVEGLAKSYINAETMIGKDKIVIPTTEEEWSDAYTKLGRPEAADGYELNIPEGLPIDDNFTNGFKAAAHEAGLNQAQLQKLGDWYSGVMQSAIESQTLAKDDKFDEASTALKQQWGEKFEGNVNLANRVLDQYASDDFLAFLEESELDNHPLMVDFLFSVSKHTAEDGGLETSGKQGDSLDPSEIQDKINELMASPAYTNRDDPSHMSVVDKVQKLYGRLHGAPAG